jgi:hypothetical protein
LGEVVRLVHAGCSRTPIGIHALHVAVVECAEGHRVCLSRVDERCQVSGHHLANHPVLDEPRNPPIVAEGSGLFPELVAPLLASSHQAIWLVPTAAFCATMHRHRGSALPAETSDPERAWCNLIDRDVLLVRYVRQRAEELALAVVEIDGSRSSDEVAAVVAEHAGLGLSPLKDRRNVNGNGGATSMGIGATRLGSYALHAPRFVANIQTTLSTGIREGQGKIRKGRGNRWRQR